MSFPFSKRSYAVRAGKQRGRDHARELLLRPHKELPGKRQYTQYAAPEQGARGDLKDKQPKEKLNTLLKYSNFQLRENYAILMQIMVCGAERIEKEHSEEYEDRNKRL